MNIEDVDSVHAIEKRCFPSPWTREMFREELKHEPRTYFFVAECKMDKAQRVIAYGGAWFVADECHIVSLAVCPDWQRRKVGEQCLLHLIDVALARGIKRLTLEVRSKNEAAIRLYEKFGFIGVALRKNYYRSEMQDALIMWIANADREGVRERLSNIRKEVSDQ